MSALDNFSFGFELDYRKAQHSKEDFNQFVLNKKCPTCGSKIYWVNTDSEYICKGCNDKNQTDGKLTKLPGLYEK